jgi:hypothetical protein
MILSPGRFSLAAAASVAALVAFRSEAAAASHLWKIHELFSSRDGAVQYIVLHECCGATQELFINGLIVESKVTRKRLTFNRNLTGSTARKHLLLATETFAALPGAPAPDFILPPQFFSTDGDVIWYSEARNYDSFLLRRGALPLDGKQALRVTNYATDTVAVVDNAPVNYAGEAGTVTVPDPEFRRGDCGGEGERNIADATLLLGWLFLDGEPGGCADACDSNDDGSLDVSDPVHMLIRLFVDGVPLPEPLDCGADPTEDGLACSLHPACADGAGGP